MVAKWILCGSGQLLQQSRWLPRVSTWPLRQYQVGDRVFISIHDRSLINAIHSNLITSYNHIQFMLTLFFILYFKFSSVCIVTALIWSLMFQTHLTITFSTFARLILRTWWEWLEQPEILWKKHTHTTWNTCAHIVHLKKMPTHMFCKNTGGGDELILQEEIVSQSMQVLSNS